MKEILRFKAEFRRTKRELELVGLIIKLFFIPSLSEKNILKVRNSFGLKIKARVLAVKYGLRVQDSLRHQKDLRGVSKILSARQEES